MQTKVKPEFKLPPSPLYGERERKMNAYVPLWSKQQLCKYKWKTDASWHVVVKTCTYALNILQRGSQQATCGVSPCWCCRPPEVFRKETEMKKNKTTTTASPQQSIIIPNKTVQAWFNTQLQFTNAPDKLLLVFCQFLGWPATKTFLSHPAMFPPGSEQAPLWWIIKLHGQLRNNTRSVSMSNVHEASAKLWVLLKHLNDDSSFSVVLFITTLHNFVGAGTSQA